MKDGSLNFSQDKNRSEKHYLQVCEGSAWDLEASWYISITEFRYYARITAVQAVDMMVCSSNIGLDKPARQAVRL